MLTLPYFLQPTGTEDDRGGLQRSIGQESPGQVQVSLLWSLGALPNDVEFHKKSSQTSPKLRSKSSGTI